MGWDGMERDGVRWDVEFRMMGHKHKEGTGMFSLIFFSFIFFFVLFSFRASVDYIHGKQTSTMDMT